MHNPKGHAVDDRGNIYLADTMNMAIRKISHAGNVMFKHSFAQLLNILFKIYLRHCIQFPSWSVCYDQCFCNIQALLFHFTGVVTIAGGSREQGLGHVDGPSEGAKFSSDFDVVYIRSSCSLLVVDRGNQAIREIQLHDDDCSHQHDDNLNLGKTKFSSTLQINITAIF